MRARALPRRRPQGVALVSVLLIVVVATALAYQIATRHSFTIAQSQLTLHGGEARQYALGGEQFARELLFADWEDEDTRATDTLLELWARIAPEPPPEESDTLVPEPLPEVPPEVEAARTTFDAVFALSDGQLELRIDDLAGRLNLNALAGEQAAANVAVLRRLLTNLGLDPAIADRWRDWIDADQEVEGMGAEDSEYLLQEPATRAANQPGIHASELQFVGPVAAEDYQRLKPYVTVLPVPLQRINVNTAAAPVLASLAPNFPPVEAEQMLAEPREFEDVQAVIATYPALGENVAALTVRSEYFRVQVRAEVGEGRAVLTSMLHRDPETGLLTLLSRSLGEPFDPPTPVDAGPAEDAVG